MEQLSRATNQLIKKVSMRLIMRGGLKNAMGPTGSISSRIRDNFLLETRLRERVYKGTVAINTLNIDQIREKTLHFVEELHIKRRPYGLYRYSASGLCPLLYASIYSCLLRHLYNDISKLSFGERREWIGYIQQHQSDDGLFRDMAVANQLADTADWWGWRHLTLHAIMALTAFGTVAQKRFKFLRKLENHHSVAMWLERRDWGGNTANVSNEIQNLGALLQYARDYQDESWADDAMDNLFTELDKLQNCRTGSWGNKIGKMALLSVTVQTGYHIWLLYFYEKRSIRFVDKIVDSCLSTQNRLGGFGSFLNSSACEDIDSIDPMARLYDLTSYRGTEIRRGCERALPWILSNMNSDGGFVFRREEPFLYGHEKMFSGINESEIFSTWFRSLSLAYVSKILHESAIIRFNWQFLQCPGYQFWR